MLTESEIKALKELLSSDEDCSEIAKDEFIADFYELDRPITTDISFEDGEIKIIAAAWLIYSKEQDGWYMGDTIEDEKEVFATLRSALSLK